MANAARHNGLRGSERRLPAGRTAGILPAFLCRIQAGWKPAIRPAGSRRSVAAVMLTLLTLTTGCSKTIEGPHPDTRETIAVMYVATPTLEIRARASGDAPVMTSYKQGEAVSVVAVAGEWAEIRTGTATGWARQDSLSRIKRDTALPDNTTVRFIRAPMAVASSARQPGEIVLEAFVNSGGSVVTVTTMRNTTGSFDLERRNRDELTRATFEPMIVDGKAQTFIYTHRVTY